jgi:hypothetical protein
MKSKALLLFLVAFYSFLLTPTAPLWAQALTLPNEADLTAPVIKHAPPTRAFRSGESVTIQATITDNGELKEATLFYREMGKEEYSSINMERLPQGIFSVSIPREDIAEPGIEYYIEAADQAGNVALRGFSFSPLTLTVTPALSDEATDETFTENVFPAEEKQTPLKAEDAPAKPWYKKWWVWAIAGAVVVGAAAAGGGGGGGGGGTQTGDATVTGPAP